VKAPQANRIVQAVVIAPVANKKLTTMNRSFLSGALFMAVANAEIGITCDRTFVAA